MYENSLSQCLDIKNCLLKVNEKFSMYKNSLSLCLDNHNCLLKVEQNSNKKALQLFKNLYFILI